MIEITLQERESSYYVKSSGHSGKKNESIVCAGVSILLESWRLTEHYLEQVEIIYQDGLVEAEIPKTAVAQVLFVQLSLGLTALSKQYPSEVSLIIGG